MLKYIQIAVVVLLTSFYFFPFEFTFLPSVNTKMAMAGFGVVMLGFQLGCKRDSLLNKDVSIISWYALVVSIMGFVAVVYNETYDYSYVTYIISMWVWLCAAYVVVMLIKQVHGEITIDTVCKYLVAVCVFQCFSALLIQYVPNVRSVVNEYIGTMSGMGRGSASALMDRGRLYGVGAALDIAGTRFASVLFILAYLCRKASSNGEKMGVWIYVISFFFIGLVGNMIARTSIVGLFFAIILWLYDFICSIKKNRCSYLMHVVCMVGIIIVPVVTLLYTHNLQFYENVRFAFEGFFSFLEKGVWRTNSTDILKDMYRFPDTFKTWLIGDGYMRNPFRTDPYYVGYPWKGFYMGTDVGYLRFIYYFGLFGLVAISLFMCKVAFICVKRQKSDSLLFWGILIINFIVWFKVSTDVFVVLALLFVAAEMNFGQEKVTESE